MKIYRWQSEQDRCFVHEDPHHSWSWNIKAFEKLAARVKNHEVSSIAFATSVLRGLRRTLEGITAAVDDVEAGPTVEEECPALGDSYVSGPACYDVKTGLPLDPKRVDVHA